MKKSLDGTDLGVGNMVSKKQLKKQKALFFFLPFYLLNTKDNPKIIVELIFRSFLKSYIY